MFVALKLWEGGDVADTQLAESHVLHGQSEMKPEWYSVRIQTFENFQLLLKIPPFVLFLNKLNLVHLTRVLWGRWGLNLRKVNWRFEHGRSSGLQLLGFSLCIMKALGDGGSFIKGQS